MNTCLDLMERHNNTLPAVMIASLSDEVVERHLWHFSLDMIKRQDAREFGLWLFRIVCHELKRRQASGEIELGSYQIPRLPRHELPTVLRLSNEITYSEFPECLAKLFDYLHRHFINQVIDELNQ
jgi:hypothetical protein